MKINDKSIIVKISAWKKLWSEVSETDFKRIKPEAAVMEESVSFGKSMGLDMDKGSINKLIEEHSEKLTIEELKEHTNAAAHGAFAGNR